MAKDFGARFRIKPGDRVQLAKRDPADTSAFGNKSAAFYMRSFYEQLFHAITLYSDHLGTRNDLWTYQPLEGRPRKTVQDPFQLMAFLYPPNLLVALDAPGSVPWPGGAQNPDDVFGFIGDNQSKGVSSARESYMVMVDKIGRASCRERV